MKRMLSLLLAVIVAFATVVSASAYSQLEPREQVKYNFKNFYSEKTGGEKPEFIECYELKDYYGNIDLGSYDYYLVKFSTDSSYSTDYHIDYFGENNEFYVQYGKENKVFEAGIAVFIGYIYDEEYKNSFYSLEEIAETYPTAIKYIEEMLGSDNVGVINGDECYKPQVDKLDALCAKVAYDFGIPTGDYMHAPGSVFIYFNEYEDIRRVADEASEVIEKTNYHYHVFSSNGVKQQEIETAYDNLESAMKSATVKKYEVEFLFEFCQDENNDDGYYPEELWCDFTDSLENARLVLDKEEATNDEYNEAYWGMMYNYNLLCSVNPLVYDVDFDGKVTVIDATYYQMVRTHLLSYNSSIGYVTQFDPLTATKIQRRLAGMDLEKPLYGQYDLDKIVNEREKTNLNSEEWEFTSWRINSLYYSARTVGRC